MSEATREQVGRRARRALGQERLDDFLGNKAKRVVEALDAGFGSRPFQLDVGPNASTVVPRAQLPPSDESEEETKRRWQYLKDNPLKTALMAPLAVPFSVVQTVKAAIEGLLNAPFQTARAIRGDYGPVGSEEFNEKAAEVAGNWAGGGLVLGKAPKGALGTNPSILKKGINIADESVPKWLVDEYLAENPNGKVDKYVLSNFMKEKHGNWFSGNADTPENFAKAGGNVKLIARSYALKKYGFEGIQALDKLNKLYEDLVNNPGKASDIMSERMNNMKPKEFAALAKAVEAEGIDTKDLRFVQRLFEKDFNNLLDYVTGQFNSQVKDFWVSPAREYKKTLSKLKELSKQGFNSFDFDNFISAYEHDLPFMGHDKRYEFTENANKLINALAKEKPGYIDNNTKAGQIAEEINKFENNSQSSNAIEAHVGSKEYPGAEYLTKALDNGADLFSTMQDINLINGDAKNLSDFFGHHASTKEIAKAMFDKQGNSLQSIMSPANQMGLLHEIVDNEFGGDWTLAGQHYKSFFEKGKSTKEKMDNFFSGLEHANSDLMTSADLKPKDAFDAHFKASPSTTVVQNPYIPPVPVQGPLSPPAVTAPFVQTKKPSTSASMAPAVDPTSGAIFWEPKTLGAELHMENMDKVGEKPGGMHGGGIFVDRSTGKKYVIKFNETENSRNEVMASKLYKAAGVDVPDMHLVDNGNGQQFVASEFRPDYKEARSAIAEGKVPGLREGFPVDAWLGNWDVVGNNFENMGLNGRGEAMRVDVGGAGRMRARGTPKSDLGEGAWSAHVPEWETLRDPDWNRNAGKVFAGVTPEQLQAGAKMVGAVDPATIRDIVAKYGPLDPVEQRDLASILIARRDSVLSQAGVYEQPLDSVLSQPKTTSGKRIFEFPETLARSLRDNAFFKGWFPENFDSWLHPSQRPPAEFFNPAEWEKLNKRANELGYTMPTWRANRRNILDNPLSYADHPYGIQYRDSGEPGLFTWTDPNAMRGWFGSSSTSKKPLPLRQKPGRILADDWEHLSGTSSYSGYKMREILQSALNNGYDSVLLKNIQDSGGMADQFINFRPENVRLPWARFDPARVRDPNLMAHAPIAPNFIGGGAGLRYVPVEGNPFGEDKE